MLGYTKAPTAEAALAVAIVEFGIPETDLKRIIIQATRDA